MKLEQLILDSENQISFLKDHSILQYKGYSGTFTRHFYNNMMKLFDQVNYLEIGTWTGSSTISALYHHNHVTATLIDNWSQFDGNTETLTQALTTFCPQTPYTLINQDCWTVDTSRLNSPFNVYLYDAGHSEQDHYNALSYYYPVLDSTFLFVVDDYNWPEVQSGTERAVKDLGLIPLYTKNIFTDNTMMPHHPGRFTWWNGIHIGLYSKSSSQSR